MYRTRLRTNSVLLSAALCLAASSVLAGGTDLPAPLRPFEATYRVVKGTFRLGTTTIRLEARGSSWRYRSVTEAEGVFSLFVDGDITETARFVTTDTGLRPLYFRHDEPDDEDDVTVRFDWDAREAHVRLPDGKRTVPLKPRTHDPFTVILSVMHGLANGAESVGFPGIDDDGEETELKFEITARESVDVPFGKFEAVRVRRIRDDKRSTITWLAPELDWLPVMIEQRRKGDLVARMELETLDGRQPEQGSQASSGRDHRGTGR